MSDGLPPWVCGRCGEKWPGSLHNVTPADLEGCPSCQPERWREFPTA